MLERKCIGVYWTTNLSSNFAVYVRLLCLVLMAWLSVRPTFAQDKNLLFLFYYQGEEPLVMQDQQTGEFTGLIPTIIRLAAQPIDVQVQFQIEQRKRAEQMLYDGSADAIMMAPQWALQPNKLIFSDVILPIRSYLFSLQPFEPNKDVNDWVANKTVCARDHYVYPVLDPAIKATQALRLDLSSHAEMIKIMMAKRCDLAYINELRAYLQFSTLPDIKKVYKSPKPLSEIGLTIAFSPKKVDFQQSLNRLLADLKAKNKLEPLIKASLLERGIEWNSSVN